MYSLQNLCKYQSKIYLPIYKKNFCVIRHKMILVNFICLPLHKARSANTKIKIVHKNGIQGVLS